MTVLPLCSALLAALAGDPPAAPTTASVAADYVQVCFEDRDLDAAFGLLSEDVSFIDPTAEIWGGPAGNGVEGRAPFRKLAEAWNLQSSHLECSRT